MNTSDVFEKSVLSHVNRCKHHVYHFHGESIFGFKFWTLNSVGAIEKWLPQHDEIFNLHLIPDSTGTVSSVRIGTRDRDEYSFDIYIAGKTLKESLAYVNQRLKKLTGIPLECASVIEAQDDLIEIEDPVWFSCYLSTVV